MKGKWILMAALSIGIFSSCNKDNGTTPDNGNPSTPEVGTVTMKFENYVGTTPLQMNGSTYTNAHGDQFTVNLYKYYLSNIKLVRQDGSEYVEPESYHLVNQGDNAKLSFQMASVPPGTYVKMKVLMGVDSARNVSGAQSGDLDPLMGMFWNWNSGYIMAKIEGTSPQSVNSQLISFHLGGFSGLYNVLQEVELNFPQPLVVTNQGQSAVTIKSDILKWFYGINTIDFSTLSQVGNHGVDAMKIAVNYWGMLSVTKVEN